MSTKLCSNCVSGHLHSGTPEGEDGQVGGLPSYITGNNDKQTLLFITDIFGYKLPNVRLLADEFAKTGRFRVVVPDFCDGNHVSIEHMKALTPLKSDKPMTEDEKGAKMHAAFGEVGPWLEKQGDDVIKPKMEKVLAELSKNSTKIGVVGFCWGGRHAVILGGGAAHASAIVANHPSYTEMSAFEALRVPTLVQAGDDDQLFPPDQVKQVKETIFSNKKDTSLKVYDGAVHGWTVRGDQNNEEEKKQKEEATQAAIDFLQQHL